MSRAVALLLFVSLNAGLSHGMLCSGLHIDILKLSIKGPVECPGDNDAKDKTHCCTNSDSNIYCCTAAEFGGSPEWKIWGIVLLVIFILASPIIVCVSCFWCSCCLVYQNRHRGAAHRRPTMA